jgi:N-acetylgalactosamine 4-sulfate 6-O-sulfotransferase
LEVMRACLAQHPAIVCATAQRQFRTRSQIQIGMYVMFCEQWLAFFPRAQLLILRQEDLEEDPQTVFDKVARFLDISPLPPMAFHRANNRPNALAKKGYRDGMLPATRALLDEFYAPFNRRLADLWGDPALAYNVTHDE